MREIKYRGIPTDNNTSYDKEDGFVEGSLIIDNNKYYIVLEVIDNIKRDDYAICMIEVIPETVRQYTGLKDKNGKEIYEGDIVSFNLKSDSEGQPYIIGYIEYQTTFSGYRIMSFEGSFALDYNIKDIEVIGNIYDNPELLKK